MYLCIYVCMHTYRTEGGQAVTDERRRERQDEEGDPLVKKCIEYADHVKAPLLMENPWTGDLKKRPTGVFIKTSKINDKTRDSALSSDSLIRSSYS